jgi:hypothetical protein
LSTDWRIDDMRTYRTYTLAAAALAAMAMASWHRTDGEVWKLNVQTERSRPADINAEAAYLPALFVEEERAARIEPMPPQF